MANFEIREEFYLDNQPVKIISGGMHYFRVLPEYWRDRLEKLKALGCNTVETYIPWNLHERQKGSFDFTGRLDVVRYVKTAQELGLMVILRPSPYICAEWEFGGLPYWLLKEDGMKLRCMYGPYLQHIREYYRVLFEIIAPLQITRGGPVILMQVENEYGYYGDDTAYMEFLKNLMIEYGCQVPLVTSDGPWGAAFDCGRVEGALPTGNFGSKGKEQFAVMREKIGNRPLMCMEFWVGWFDAWGDVHHVGDLEGHVKDLEDLLSEGHVNLYMFEGGTNFGFMNGANDYERLEPDVTSYDYDALLTEDGQITEKYRAFQKVIGRHTVLPDVSFSTCIKRKAYGTIQAARTADLFSNLENLSVPVKSQCPVCMEKLNQGYGYILYESDLGAEAAVEQIRLWKAGDRAKIYLEEQEILTLYDRELLTEHACDGRRISDTRYLSDPREREYRDALPGRVCPREGKLDILMENMGRVNFTPVMEEQRKGIDGGVQINGHLHFGWTIYPLPMEDLTALDFAYEAKEGAPGFYEFCFEVEEAADTFLSMDGWGKGIACINGFNLGRFWEIGPQKSLYVPAPLLKKGKNILLIFETEGKRKNSVEFKEAPDL